MQRMNPMKMTAYFLLVIGVLVAGYAVMAMATGGPVVANGGPDTPSPANATPIMSNPWVLFPFAAAALFGGIGMLMYGGRGAIHTRNPAVRR